MIFRWIRSLFTRTANEGSQVSDHAPQFKKQVKRQATVNNRLRGAIIRAEKHGSLNREKMPRRKQQISPVAPSRRGRYASQRITLA
jgi:hypothetical protein